MRYPMQYLVPKNPLLVDTIDIWIELLFSLVSDRVIAPYFFEERLNQFYFDFLILDNGMDCAYLSIINTESNYLNRTFKH